MQPKWRDLILVSLSVLFVAGLLADAGLEKDTWNEIMINTSNFVRYLIEEFTTTIQRNDL